jgi:hypothetical protein
LRDATEQAAARTIADIRGMPSPSQGFGSVLVYSASAVRAFVSVLR